MDFFQCVKVLWSRMLNILPLPLKKKTTKKNTLGQRKSSTTITQAAATREKKNSYFHKHSNWNDVTKESLCPCQGYSLYRAYLQPIVQLGLWGSHWFMFEGVQSRQNYSFIAHEKKQVSIRGFYTIWWRQWKVFLPPAPPSNQQCGLLAIHIDISWYEFSSNKKKTD